MRKFSESTMSAAVSGSTCRVFSFKIRPVVQLVQLSKSPDKKMAENRQRAAVVVLGDFGRSPRMQYHTLSLAQQAHLEVDLVANGESTVCSYISCCQTVQLVERMVNDIRQAKDIHDFVTCGNLIHGLDQCGETMFTSQIDDDIILKPNRPALVVSSTSWTQDEDFNILLQAALMYDRRVAASLGEDDSVDEERLWIEIDNKEPQLFPRLLFIITGKGPERRRYEEQIRKLKLRRVAFRTMWLSAEDYPLLLGSADLGVSLHTSSSGLDLPMKVVDMFGCGLPVCAASFSCIEELVKVDENGLLFSSPTELADEFMMLFRGFPEKCQTLQSLKEGALATCSSSKWSSEWETCALPLISEILLGNKKDVERN